MKTNLELEQISNNLENSRWPVLIAGPCSAESELQLLNTAKALKESGKVSAFRAGVWKPRTRPGGFEGYGLKALEWMKVVKQETGMKLATEVATREHVEMCLKAGIDILWIGARTSPNPFSVQEIANALIGCDVTVLVKNPVNADLPLWIGALERFNKAGIKKLGAIHRGFSTPEESIFRNSPMWNIPIELKRQFPNLPIICDPSHIGGKRELIPFIAQKALDLDFDGLMIETHVQPDIALSDAQQQITPGTLSKIILDLIIRDVESKNNDFVSLLDTLRRQIDEIDEQILQKISARMKISAKIGEFKRDNNVTILQVNRWEEILQKRIDFGSAMGISPNFMKNYLQLIHQESIRIQTEIMNAKGIDE